MKNKLKYFGIYKNCYDFKKLPENEQKEILIKHQIYIKGKRKDIYDDNLVNHGHIDRSQNILYIGQDFIHNKINHTLNPDFIDEVYNTIIDSFENGLLKNIHEQIKVLSLTFETLVTDIEKNNFISNTKETAKLEYIKNLNNKIFQDFHSQQTVDVNFKQNVIKKHLIYDINHLSNYIFGLANFQSFLVIHCYHTYLRLSEKLNFCDKHNFDIEKTELEKIDFTKPSVPKSIAMLKASGFFELENIQKLPPMKLYQVIAIIIGKDPNNKSDNRSIRGNYNVLNKNSEENPINFTTNTHTKSMIDLLKQINKGDF